jgi:hypothetical protein
MLQNALTLSLVMVIPLTAFSSCLSLSKMTAKGTASIAPLGEQSSRSSHNAELVNAAVPSSILMLEASLKADKTNTDLILQLAKAYQALATTKIETDLLLQGETRKDSTNSDAIATHERAVYYSRKFMELNAVQWNKEGDGLEKSLSLKSNDQKVVDTAFIAAASLKSIIAIAGKRATFLTLLPLAQKLSHFSCSGSLRPSYPIWSCDTMRGVELAETPSLAGGDLKASKSTFNSIYQNHKTSLMPLALWAQFLLSKDFDKTDWDMIKNAAATYRKSSQEKIFQTINGPSSAPDGEDEAYLNSVALIRIDYMTSNEKTFFNN